MKLRNSLILMFVVAIISCSASNYYFAEKQSVNIIPKPNKITVNKGEFVINSETKIVTDDTSVINQNVINSLNNVLLRTVGYKLEIASNVESGSNSIKLNLVENDFGNEGYQLNIDEKGILISGNYAGLFYGIQTLLQLLPPEIFSTEKVDNLALKVPFIVIEDIPRFAWRGMHLDVGRHMFPIDFIKKYIDYLAFHKLNVFHWHLTEDQGWRIEIKKYPKLTEISAFRNETIIGHHSNNPQKFDGQKYGGFYTQEEIKEVVKYATERFINVVPEIEMPGHAIAGLAAYPELSCIGGPFDVRTSWGISDDIYCAGNEATFEFLENVLSEVVELFPSKLIHIGGDEAPKVRWEECSKCQKRILDEKLADEHELQSYFVQRIEKFLNSKGKEIIGWDEILEGGLAPNATVMSWRGNAGAIAAAKQKHNVVMAPTTHCYFDYYQTEQIANEPLAIGGFVPLEKVYSLNPVPVELTANEAKYIIGAQGNVWTEYMPTSEQVEYMVFPRISAMSEVVWTNVENKNFTDFQSRMKAQYKRFDSMKINYFMQQ